MCLTNTMGNGEQAVATYKAQLLRRGLSPRHREAMRRLSAGQAPATVARELGYSSSHLSTIMSSPLFKREMERMQARADQIHYDALAELRAIQPHAVEAYKDLLQQTEYKLLRFNVAKDVLDRTGVEAPKVVHQVQATQTYEQKLAEVKSTYTVSGGDTSPIEVIGGEDLLKNYDKE